MQELLWTSPTDPDARIMQHADGHIHLSYRVDATGDLETGIIVKAGTDYGDQSDQATCLDRVDEAVRGGRGRHTAGARGG